MPIIKRYSQVDEYSSLISTKSTASGRPKTAAHGPQSTFDDIIPADWLSSICPPVSDIQSAMRRFQTRPEISQERIFGFIYPLYLFTVFFAAAAVAFQPISVAFHVLSDPRNHPSEMVFGFVALGVLMLAGVVILRGLIWAVAKVVNTAVEMDMGVAAAAPQAGLTEQPLTAGILLRGLFA
ncbi:hypothetical protein BXZ70DRAFT_344721 [Cristinia sonorae]|uniref:Uncharacterized protein n=1 Tax=Cristinia sonorae TaxID=1940300 RepID=A0A8K0UM85_9AGAR|nr:hypothetical protein BXZ70DRAFT_344721 [Cristinia sonorae]